MEKLRVIHSIKMRLLLMILVAGAVPMIVSMAVFNHQLQSVLLKKVEYSLLESAQTRERMLSDHVEVFKASAKAISILPTIRRFLIDESVEKTTDESAPSALMRTAGIELSKFQEAYWGTTHHIFLVDRSGRVVLSSPQSGWDESMGLADIGQALGPHTDELIADEDFFKQALDGPLVTDFFEFEEGDHFHQLILQPVFDSAGDIVGLVAIEIAIESIEQLMADEFSIGDTGVIYIATSTGLRVVHKKEDYNPTPNTNSGAIHAKLTQEPISGWYEPEPGHEVFGVYQASRIYPWVVCVEVDRSEVLAPVRAQQRSFLFIMIAGLSVFSGMVFFVSRLFWKPLGAIALSAQRVADGDLWHEIPVTRDDEIGQIELAVDAMRFSMKQQIDHLDALVAERTASLEYVNEKLEHDASHDGLTGLANRSVLEEMLERELEQYQSDSSHLISVLFFDFDRFKVVNDSLGHATGDALLCSIAERFRRELRKTDLVARFGGDEFVVMLSPVESGGHAHEAADRLLRIFEDAHVIDGHRITSTASIGLVVADPRYINAADMIRDADAAMYQAKLAGKGQVIEFDEDMFEVAKRRLRLEEDLNEAIKKNQLRVVYQPIIGMEEMTTVGFEALMRWEHPELGMVRPDHFIPIAEDTGQIVEVGAWILRESVEQIVRWDKEYGLDGTLSINVNVAKRQLIHPEFLGLVKDVLETTGLAPHRLKIEITESTAIDPRHDMSQVIKRVRELGVLIAMDDFGTGHSSLSLLHQFDFDILKIDQSFVQGMEESREMSAVLHSIIALAQNTGMKVVAEGAETKTQVSCLISHECDMIQGYYFSRPLPPKEAGEFIASPHDYTKAA